MQNLPDEIQESSQEAVRLRQELRECQDRMAVLEDRLMVYETLEPEFWAFTRKRSIMDRLLGMTIEQLQHLPEQDWYTECLAMLEIRLTHAGLQNAGQFFYEQLAQAYHKYGDDDRKHIVVLAMLLYLSPLELTVPLETHRWPQRLRMDVEEIFA